MTVKQISVFVENKPGKLAELTEYLEQHDIDMRALSIAETQDFGIVRMIVDDAYKTSCVLKEAGYVASITPVLAVEMPDEPGSLFQILRMLGEGGVNLEYMYAFLTPKQATAYMVLRVADNEKAMDILSKKGIRAICQDAIADLW
ncbi:acetolactate synthase [Lachnospiraceae bacterium]|nr:acetolactate synthase [Lachnospiraceae bacterium]